MRLRRHVELLESSLKHLPTRPLLASQCSRYRYSTSTTGPPKEIAIVGGGITGLASAYFISKEYPQANITIYDQRSRLGGWLRSEHVDVPGGRILFESGPRTLRPNTNSLPTAWLVQELGLVPDVIYTPKNAPSARNRFVYYPDHLVRMPGPPMKMFEAGKLVSSEEVFGGIMWAVLTEYFKSGRPANLVDESIGSFISRRFDKRIAENLVSALMHGIYAGDVWQLSIKSILPLAWRLEGDYGGIIKGMYTINSGDRAGSIIQDPRDAEMIVEMRKRPLAPEFQRALTGCSVFSFRNGIQQMANRLEEVLRGNDRISIKLDTEIEDIKLKDENAAKVEIETSDLNSSEAPTTSKETKDVVISTVPATSLSRMCPSFLSTIAPIVGGSPFHDSVTVMVVNLYFSNTDLLPVEGFGYLLPQSLPFEQNPERALGVIFDSDAMKGQDTADGTKVTVMLGGHWWDSWSVYPSETEGIAMARSILARHLNITDEPVVARATLQENCIPQYKVGHQERLKVLHETLVKDYRGRVRVAGSSYSGVGVNDCIRAARDVAKGLSDDGWDQKDRTGLNFLYDDRSWVLTRMTGNV